MTNVFILVIACFICALLNKLIGLGEDRGKIFGTFYKVRRPFSYLVFGMMGLGLNYYYHVDLSLTGTLLSFFVPVLGTVLYRQPGPDCVFSAIAGRPTHGVPECKLVNWCVSTIHKINPEVLPLSTTPTKYIVRYGVISGIYRGMYILPMAIILSYFNPYNFMVGSLGCLMGLCFWVCGPFGLFKREEYAADRAEYLTGAVIIAPNIVLPFMMSVFNG